MSWVHVNRFSGDRLDWWISDGATGYQAIDSRILTITSLVDRKLPQFTMTCQLIKAFIKYGPIDYIDICHIGEPQYQYSIQSRIKFSTSQAALAAYNMPEQDRFPLDYGVQHAYGQYQWVRCQMRIDFLTVYRGCRWVSIPATQLTLFQEKHRLPSMDPQVHMFLNRMNAFHHPQFQPPSQLCAVPMAYLPWNTPVPRYIVESDGSLSSVENGAMHHGEHNAARQEGSQRDAPTTGTFGGNRAPFQLHPGSQNSNEMSSNSETTPSPANESPKTAVAEEAYHQHFPTLLEANLPIALVPRPGTSEPSSVRLTSPLGIVSNDSPAKSKVEEATPDCPSHRVTPSSVGEGCGQIYQPSSGFQVEVSNNAPPGNLMDIRAMLSERSHHNWASPEAAKIDRRRSWEIEWVSRFK